MYLGLNKISQLMVVLTALVCSRTVFWFLADPEGPNLLVVAVMAIAIGGIAVVLYKILSQLLRRVSVLPQVLVVISIVILEIGVTGVLYWWM